MTSDIETEICVIGGGPAGAVAALRLAQLGRQVCLLERAAFPRSHIGESLPSSVWPIFRALNLEDRVNAADFLRSTGSILLWGGVFERRGAPADQPGLMVDRARFDALLLDAAGDAGVQVIQPARAYRPRRSGTGWEIPILTSHGKMHVSARLLLDAAGKQAGLGRKVRAASQPLLALHAYWRTPPGFGAETRVEAGDAHWYWGAALPDGTVSACVFLDPGECSGLSPVDRRDMYLNMLARSTLLAPCLEQRRVGRVRYCDATSLCDATPSSADFLRVGEASFSVDALSSQGVQLAMGQAMQAAVVINTVMSRPSNTDLALAFYQDRQHERVVAHAGLASAFYARQHSVNHNEFWTTRATALDWLCRDPPDLEQAAMPQGVRLGLSPAARMITSGVQTDAYVARAQVLDHPNLARPAFNLGGVMLAPLIAALAEPAPAEEISRRWSDQLDPARAARVLEWLWQTRILEPAA